MPRSRMRPPAGTVRHNVELYLTDAQYKALAARAAYNCRSVTAEVLVIVHREVLKEQVAL